MKPTILIHVFLGLLTAGCGKKTAPGAGDGGGAGATAASPTAPTAPTAPTTPPAAPTAEGGDVAALKDVTECPKSLAGTEQVARVIKKECGPIRVTAGYYIEGSLTLEAGVVLKFDEGAELGIGYTRAAKLITKGTAADPVVLTAAGDQVAGFWKGVVIYRQGNRSRVEGVVIDYAGGDRGALSIDADDVVVKGVTIRNAKDLGLKIENEGSLAEMSGNTFEKVGALAMSLPASQVATLGEDSKIEAGALIEVRGTGVEKSSKWKAAGAPYLMTGETNVDGKTGRTVLELQPGVELRFAEGGRLNAGYYGQGGITAVGTAEKPITFTANGEKKVGAWYGLHLYDNGEGTFEHVVLESGGQEDDKGAITADGRAAVSIKATTFKGNRAALVIADSAKLKAYEGNKHSGDEKRALLVSARHVGAIGTGNTFEGENEKIEVRGGSVEEGATWLEQPVPIEVSGEVNIDTAAPLVLSPGLDLRFRDGVKMTVGYYKESKLTAVGSAEKPIKMRGVREEPGSWDGLVLNANTRSSKVENVELTYAGGEGGVVAKGGAVVDLKNVTCVKCTVATLAYECTAKVTAADIKAGEGTPVGEKKPEGCP